MSEPAPDPVAARLAELDQFFAAEKRLNDRSNWDSPKTVLAGPQLIAALRAVLTLAEEWDQEAATGPYARCEALSDCAAELREAVARELPAGDGGPGA